MKLINSTNNFVDSMKQCHFFHQTRLLHVPITGNKVKKMMPTFHQNKINDKNH